MVDSSALMRILGKPSKGLLNALNKYDLDGCLRGKLTLRDVLAVAHYDLGIHTGISRADAESVGGDLERWGKTGDFLFLGRPRKLSEAEERAAAIRRCLSGGVDSPSDAQSHQELVNAIHEKLDAAETPEQRNNDAIVSMLASHREFKPLKHGERPAGRVQLSNGDFIPARTTMDLGINVKNLRLVVENLEPKRRGLAICENCQKFFLRKRRDKRRCSDRCSNQHRARIGMRKLRRRTLVKALG